MAAPRKRSPYVPRSFPLGLEIDVASVGKALALLDELDRSTQSDQAEVDQADRD